MADWNQSRKLANSYRKLRPATTTENAAIAHSKSSPQYVAAEPHQYSD
mgnify:CR=1 FL=1